MNKPNIRELQDLLKEVRSSARRAIAAVDQCLARSAEMEATREERDAAVRAQALREFSDLDPDAFWAAVRRRPSP